MTKGISVIELAAIVNGRTMGNIGKTMQVTGTCALDNYTSGKVSFLRKEAYSRHLANIQNGVILIPESLIDVCRSYPKNVYIVVENAENSMMDMQDFFYGNLDATNRQGIAPSAIIDANSELGRDVHIGAFCHIEPNVSIGDGTVVYPMVSIYEGCTIGSNCVIDSGAVIGADGFRYEQHIGHKTVRKMHHVGSVVLGDRVEVGANTVIDRATFEQDATTIGDDVKIDNLVHIAHNARIGARTIIVAQTCVGGSVKIGEDAWVGIGVAISNGVTIGNRARLLLNAIVAYDVKDDEVVSGFYAMPHKQWKQLWRNWIASPVVDRAFGNTEKEVRQHEKI